jgi:hypothetical protein
MTAKISISVAEPELLEWAKHRAEQQGISLSAVVSDALRRARQQQARDRVLEWLGDAAKLTPEREAEIVAQWQARPRRTRAKKLRRKS